MMKGSLPQMDGKISLISWKNQTDGWEAFQGQARPPSWTKQPLLCNIPTSSEHSPYSKATTSTLYMGGEDEVKTRVENSLCERIRVCP